MKLVGAGAKFEEMIRVSTGDCQAVLSRPKHGQWDIECLALAALGNLDSVLLHVQLSPLGQLG